MSDLDISCIYTFLVWDVLVVLIFCETRGVFLYINLNFFLKSNIIPSFREFFIAGKFELIIIIITDINDY